jgi:anti-sigma factor RsiW
MNERADLYLLSAFIDDELTEEEALRVKREIIRSERWKAEYEELKELDRLLHKWDERELEGIRASASYEKRLIQRLQSLKR